MLFWFGLGIGLLGGFFGSGGGILAVALLQKQGLEPRRAHATSIAIILPLSLISLVVYWLNGNLPLTQSLPFFVPAPKAPDEAGAFWLSGNPDGCAIWSDVATMMPWAVYENYGDLSLLREEYPVMKAWVERIRQDDQADGGRGLWLRGRQLGPVLNV